MFSLFGRIFSYFSYEKTRELCEKELEEELAKLENEVQEEKEKNFEKKDVEKAENVVGKNCFQKTGIITSIQSNHGIIDKILLFDILTATSGVEELQVGFRVEYLAYKSDDSEFVKVVKIIQVLNDYWDEKPSEDFISNQLDELKLTDPEYFSTHKRSILGLIVHRNENFITVDTDYEKMDVDLDSVSLEFIPQLGDRVYLNCNVQTDLSFVDSAGEILDILSIFPARSKNIKATVTDLYDSWGIVNGDCMFTFDILSTGYKPSESDTVSAEVIECSRGNFVWRCIKIVPLETTKTPIIRKPSSDVDLFTNKNGIVITADIKFHFDHLFDSTEQELIVTNESDRVHKVLRSVFLGKKSQSQLKLLEPGMKDSFFINPGESRSFRMQGKAQFYGLSKEIFVITFAAGFKIGRRIQIEVGVNEKGDDKENLPAKNRSTRNGVYANQVWSKKYDIVPGISVNNKPKFVVNRIPMYDVPERLRSVVLTSRDKNDMRMNLDEMFPSLSEGLSHYNYTHRFQTLLHLEEIEYFLSIRKYDQERVHFIREGEYLALEIENLAEKRPSLIIGDSVKVTNPWAEATDNRCYEGNIHKVLFNRILLKFNPGFQDKYNGEDYSVEFYFSRFGFRKQHYAIKKVIYHLGQEILFPSKIKLNEEVQLNVSLNEDYELVTKESRKIKWYNPNLNSVQKIAIKNVLRGEARPMPYVIFGPPGTGKTMTLVETILQLVTLLPNTRLLVGTPSNSSADLIATRLIGCEALKPGDFVRLVSHNLVERDIIPDHLKPYCATADIAAEGSAKDNMIITESGLKLKCQLKHLGRHRITIGTCSTLGTLLQMGFQKGHFTHVLVDEAGQCVEPEIMIVLTQVDRCLGQIILAGDPLQLGPIVLYKYAAEKGLELSFLERILNTIPYKQDRERFPETGYDPRLVTKLIFNYRSLPSILKTFNNLFYNSELKAMIDEHESKDSQLLQSLGDILPNPETRSQNHGVFFVGIRGDNRQDPDSPSWYNAAEAKSVFLFVIKLYKKQISPKSIGIITPYQKQVRTIRNIFAESDMVLPKIGSVEEFQGQERDIILISTVRSKKSLLHLDLRHALGFVQSTKRMNVAISRARSLLIIFGNPHLLALDSYWEKLLKYCIEHDAYIGCDLPSHIL